MVAKLAVLFTATVLMTHPASAVAQTPPPASVAEPIRYTVSFPAPQTHYVEVSAVVPTARRR